MRSLIALALCLLLAGCHAGVTRHAYSVINEAPQVVWVQYAPSGETQPFWTFEVAPGDAGKAFGGIGEDYVGGWIRTVDAACNTLSELRLTDPVQAHAIGVGGTIVAMRELPEDLRGLSLQAADDPCRPGFSTGAP